MAAFGVAWQCMAVFGGVAFDGAARHNKVWDGAATRASLPEVVVVLVVAVEEAELYLRRRRS